MIEVFFFLALLLFIILIFNYFKKDLKPCIYIFFIFFIVSVVCNAISFIIFDNNFQLIKFLGSFWMLTALTVVILHSVFSMGYYRALILLSISFIFGLFSEYVGVAYGWIFGNYYYNLDPWYFGVVPFLTPISWVVIIYMAYSITNLIQNNFNILNNAKMRFPFYMSVTCLILLSTIDGFIAVNLDMLLDPVSVSKSIEGWVWIMGGPYYNVPISNFIGWFFVTFFATLIFRTYEFLKSEHCKNETINLVIPGLYCGYFIIHSVLAIYIKKPELLLIGATTMMPFIILPCLYLFSNENINWRN